VLGIASMVLLIMMVTVITVIRLTAGGARPVSRADPGPVLLVPGYGGNVQSLQPLAAELRWQVEQLSGACRRWHRRSEPKPTIWPRSPIASASRSCVRGRDRLLGRRRSRSVGSRRRGRRGGRRVPTARPAWDQPGRARRWIRGWLSRRVRAWSRTAICCAA
jgi:hypothetical protein